MTGQTTNGGAKPSFNDLVWYVRRHAKYTGGTDIFSATWAQAESIARDLGFYDPPPSDNGLDAGWGENERADEVPIVTPPHAECVVPENRPEVRGFEPRHVGDAVGTSGRTAALGSAHVRGLSMLEGRQITPGTRPRPMA
jgi:hypothetical protein